MVISILNLAFLIAPIIVISLVLAKFGTIEGKGKRGERVAERAIKKAGYQVISDLYVSASRGWTQIDHVVIAGGALVCIEVKNYAGSIYGQKHEKSWTQVCGRQKNKFQNPIHQNHAHVCSLRELFPEVDVRGFVAFTPRSTFKRDRPDGVGTTNNLKEVLDRIAANVPTSPAAAQAWSMLQSMAASERQQDGRKAHREQLRQRNRM
ncbi:Nuclease-related domain-containing protein [Azospirillum oryzae]|uniref:Nuclease-related domain-containing protein n=1 Tax=Azospirillum oryzae TaxID=286727 RepID=A0A1X7HIT7_9PROT|nr:nuclease-related domain-containing protein [Azospirillum oryzae]SMF87462.1 Nuclease-related domain-containing protein [Azospirillum oryzae]